MKYIAIAAVLGVLLLQSSGAIPMSSVGGPLTIALAFFIAALAVAIHEAWTKKRGPFGWIVNIVVSFIGVFMAAQLGGFIMVMILPFEGTSLAKSGGAVLSIALAGTMLFSVFGAWGALQIVNKWR